MSDNISTWLILGIVFLLAVLAIHGWRRRSVPGALPFAAASLFAALWMASFVIEQAAPGPEAKIFWIKVQKIWQLPALTCITCFILEYAWPGRWLTRRNLALLSFMPLLSIVLVLTNNFHHLLWAGFKFSGSIIPLQGAAAQVMYAYVIGLSVVNIIVLAWLFVRSPQHRWPAAIMLAGQIAVRAAYLLGEISWLRTSLPLDILGIGLIFLVYAIILYGFRIFDPVALARKLAVEQIRAGMLVLDLQGRVISLNPAVERILLMPASRIRGKPIQQLLPVYPVEPLAGTNVIEIRLPAAEQKVTDYSLTILPLKDWRGLEVGCLLLLRDVTLQKQAHAQLIAQQRAQAMLQEREQLARELHDNLGQVFAFVNVQGQAARRLLSRGDVISADAVIGRLVEAAREADVDIRETILGLRAALAEHGLFPALEHYLTQYEKNYGIHTRLERPAASEDETFEPLVEVQLLRILQEALTNVRKHAAAQQVQITFALEGRDMIITVKDDGQGFLPNPGGEESSEHVGLRVMRERAHEVGGSMSLHSEPGLGTTVVVRMPVEGKKEGSNYA